MDSQLVSWLMWLLKTEIIKPTLLIIDLIDFVLRCPDWHSLPSLLLRWIWIYFFMLSRRCHLILRIKYPIIFRLIWRVIITIKYFIIDEIKREVRESSDKSYAKLLQLSWASRRRKLIVNYECSKNVKYCYYLSWYVLSSLQSTAKHRSTNCLCTQAEKARVSRRNVKFSGTFLGTMNREISHKNSFSCDSHRFSIHNPSLADPHRPFLMKNKYLKFF